MRIAITLVTTIFFLVGLTFTCRIWRGHHRPLMERRLGPATHEAAVARTNFRVLPIASVTGLGMFGAMLVLQLVRAKSSAWYAALTVFGVSVAAFMVLTPVIAFFRRPRWMIPPQLRDEPGEFADALRRSA
jgi:hypothetical protein